jgi:hypothetical protein
VKKTTTVAKLKASLSKYLRSVKAGKRFSSPSAAGRSLN